MDGLSLQEVEEEIRKAESYLRSGVFQPVREPEEIRSKRPSGDLDRAEALGPSSMGTVVEERVALGTERDVYLTTTHSKSDGRRDSRGPASKNEDIYVRLVEERIGRADLEDGIPCVQLDLTGEGHNSGKGVKYGEGEAQAATASRRLSSSGAGPDELGSSGRYDSEAGREALLERLLKEYREGKKQDEDSRRQSLVSQAQEQQRDREAGQEIPPTLRVVATPERHTDRPPYEHLLLDSPGPEAEGPLRGLLGEDDGLFYASDLIKELHGQRAEEHQLSHDPEPRYGGGGRAGYGGPVGGLGGDGLGGGGWEEVVYGSGMRVYMDDQPPQGRTKGQVCAAEDRSSLRPPSALPTPPPQSRSPPSKRRPPSVGSTRTTATHRTLTPSRATPQHKRGATASSTKAVYGEEFATVDEAGGAQKAGKQEAEATKEFTFKPRINDYSKVTQKSRPPLTETIANLARPQLQVYAERERVRREQEARVVQECTFRPQLCKGTEKRTRGKMGSQPVPERLLQRFEEAVNLKNQARHIIEEQKMQECTFRPRINPDSVAIVEKSYKPIHQRLAELQRAKRENLQALQMSAELQNTNLTFQPRICSNSDRIARSRRRQEGKEVDDEEDGNVGVRLMRESKRFEEQRRRKLREISEEQWREYVGVPKPSKGSERLAKENEELQLAFLDRQQVLEQKTRRRQEQKRAVCLEEEKRWFKPSIGKAEQVLLRGSRPEHAKENIEQRVERLAHQERLHKEGARVRRAEDYYSQYTFEPQINKVSQLLGRTSSTTELVHNWRGEMARVRLLQEAEERQKQECTFSPQLATKNYNTAAQYRSENGVAWQQADVDVRGPRYYEGMQVYPPNPPPGPPQKPRLSLNMRDPDAMAEDLDRYRREKEEYTRQVQAEREIQELQECTFQPAIIKRRPRTQTPVVVRGLGKFLEQREHALRLQKEREDRKRNVFTVKPTARKGADGSTVVEPFNLSEGVNKRSKENVRQEVEREFRSECTFKPRTIETVRREAIRMLLTDEASVASEPQRERQAHPLYLYHDARRCFIGSSPIVF